MPVFLLIDNGSLRAASTLNLRKIAAETGRRVNRTIVPVSLLHSSAVDPAELGGEPAEILEPALRRRLEAGEDEFVVVPLFFGPSRALTEYLPKRLNALKAKHPGMRARVARCLFDPLEATDLRLAAILKERVEEVLEPGEMPPVVLVDHGSPAPEVTRVRDLVGGQLSALLQGRIGRITVASMERRPGEKYDFSGPLLESVLGREGFNRGRIIVSMMFLSPGRHAGEEGDVGEICRRVEKANPDLSVTMTGLVGDHPGLVDILVDRFREEWGGEK